MRVARAAGIGAVAGAALGTLFAIAVVSFADCAGPSCSSERVVGIIGHALGGGLVGALAGVLIAAVARLLAHPRA